MNPEVAAYFFDLDGTLIDSEPWHKKAEVSAFSKLGISLTEEELHTYTGTTIDHFLSSINAKFDTQITVEEFLFVEQPILQNFIQSEIKLFADVLPRLEALGSTKRVVVTSSMKWYLDSILNQFPVLADSFSHFVCHADVIHGKPHPEPYLLAAKLLNVEPSSALVIEDSVNGVASGRAAGCWVVGIDRESKGHLKQANRVISSLNEPYFDHV